MSVNRLENDEQILEALEEEVSDVDELEYDISDEYDSDEDPEYFPPDDEEIESVYDVMSTDIRNLENAGSGNRPNEKRKNISLNIPGTSRDNNKKRKNEPRVSSDEENRGGNRRKKSDRPNLADLQVPVIVEANSDTMVGKDNFVWHTKYEATPGKTPAKNIIHITPGPTANARQASEPIDCFKLFFTQQILDIIVVHTNEEISRKRENYKDPEHFCLKNVNREEIEAYLGLLILSAALKDNHLAVKLLFDSNYCGDRYRATMTERRFQFITDCLRFDEKMTREQRKNETKLAAISEIWELFVNRCIMNYKPSSYVTIDEQLVGFRGKCPFRMYIPSKPNKYGMKLVMMCDNSTKYMVNAMPYLGKGTVPPKTPAADYFVEKLVAPTISGSNRNITIDNWFTNIPLAERLLEESKVTIVGTIKKNKRELPKEFVDPKFRNRDVGSSLFLFHEEITAVSFKPKLNKIVTLISTMHQGGSVNEKSKKPEIILTYNSTKGSVDTFDQMCQNMNCGRKTMRWPLCYFYNMINIAAVNAYVIYLHNSHRSGKDKTEIFSRMKFMLNLHEKLTEDFQRSRLENRNLSNDLKLCIERVVGRQERPVVAANQQGQRRYCSFCDYKKKRMTTTYCPCGKAICGEHMRKKCPDCG